MFILWVGVQQMEVFPDYFCFGWYAWVIGSNPCMFLCIFFTRFPKEFFSVFVGAAALAKPAERQTALDF